MFYPRFLNNLLRSLVTGTLVLAIWTSMVTQPSATLGTLGRKKAENQSSTTPSATTDERSTDDVGRAKLTLGDADPFNLPSAMSPVGTIEFSASSYIVSKGDQRVTIAVNRSGDTTGTASVGYATIDDAGLQNCDVKNGIASPRCDYENTIGTLTFAAGETSKSFSVAIVGNSYAKGNEIFRVTLNNPSGATLATPSTASVTIMDNATADGPNPIDNTNFFVRQQYLDFLGREPDPPGFAGWTSSINNCSGDTTQCDRIHVSLLFFQSPEFQERGYFVYRFYPVSFGRKPDYAEFVVDLARVSGFLTNAELEAAKVQFIADFMARPAFANTYNSPNTPAGNPTYVDALLNTAGVTLSSRQSMIDGLNNGTLTRAQVLRQIVESAEVSTKYNHQAYAVMEYFGYLRRDPDALYLNWIQVLDQTNDPRGMVTGFANSLEYRQRFGPLVNPTPTPTPSPTPTPTPTPALPPDPSGVAPPIDSTVATNIFDATKFLYTGNPPIQTGVAPGTIKPIQAAVLRGRVVDSNSAPIPGVKVTILNHAEFGQTLSRIDGMFDMAVNGGGLLTVDYTKDGYLPLQRQMNVPWQDYSMVHDVCMIPFDPNVTTIDMASTAPIQVARGSAITDSSGTRQATLFFKQGTTATMTLSNGSTQPLSTLHARATEFTVGNMGPMSMPGDLPPTSIYTYAADFSVDEGVAAKAITVSFNQPVVNYIENFLNFPAGTTIPSGFYDHQSGIWIPSANGLVIKILSVTTGAANLDIDGSGNPASDSALTALGINAAERQQLAALYSVGQSLWRIPINHFSDDDWNWSGRPPDNGRPNDQNQPPSDQDPEPG